MPNKLYQEQQQQEQQNNPMNAFNQFMQNPLQALTQSKLNVPNQYNNDPKGAVQHLLNTGQISQDKFNKVMQIANKWGIKF